MTTIKNGTDIRRTELEQCCRKLKVAETKCGSLKSKINYMKMFCQIKTDTKETQPPTNNLSRTSSNLQEHELLDDSRINCNINPCDSNISTSIHQNCYAYMEENPNSQDNSNGDFETEKCNNEISKLNKIEDSYTISHLASTTSVMKPIIHEAEQGNQQGNISKYLSPDIKKQDIEHATQMKNDVLNFKETTEQLIINNLTEWNNRIPSFTNPNINSQELRSNISSSVKNACMSKYKSLMKENKDLTINTISVSKKKSVCKSDQIVSNKIKKKRGKLRNINSKSTIATKELNITAKRDMKKRKQKDNKTTCQLSEKNTPSSKLQHNWNGIVELYHNAAMKSDSISAVSSKLESQVKKITKRSNAHNDQCDMHLKLDHTYDQCQNYQHNPKNQQDDHKLTISEITTVEEKDTYKQILNTDRTTISNHECKLYEQQNTMFNVACYVPLVNHNYEMPTVSSKLKRTNRSYFDRFNFRNIPFVVGTSISPSHNLGLNIQQVLSIIKTRQPPVTGVTPLLIRKVSRGLEPVSTLMKQMVGESHDMSVEKNVCDSNAPEKQCPYPAETSESQKKTEVFAQKETNNFIITDNIEEQKIQIERKPITNYCPPSKDTTHLKTEFLSQLNLKSFPEATSYFPKEGQSTVNSIKSKSNMQLSESKGIREVLLNLHDQFEAMNIKYEKLQKKLENSNDPTLMNEITTLEKELNAKEEEINALISLYKEVMALKQQMKMLQQRNSLVCIATKMPATSRIYSSNPVTFNKMCKPYAGDAMHTYNIKKRNIISATRETSTSMKLTELLRQIQMFQKQLKLAS